MPSYDVARQDYKNMKIVNYNSLLIYEKVYL